jgi:hypothetical protein
VRDDVAKRSAAEASGEGLLAPLVELVVFGGGVLYVVSLAAAVVEAIATQMIGSANRDGGSVALDIRWGSHLLDNIVKLGSVDARPKLLEPRVHLGVPNLLSLFLGFLLLGVVKVLFAFFKVLGGLGTSSVLDR